MLINVTSPLKCLQQKLRKRVQKLLEQIKTLQKENDALKQKVLLAEADEMLNAAVEHEGVKILTKKVEVSDVDESEKPCS